MSFETRPGFDPSVDEQPKVIIRPDAETLSEFLRATPGGQKLTKPDTSPTEVRLNAREIAELLRQTPGGQRLSQENAVQAARAQVDRAAQASTPTEVTPPTAPEITTVIPKTKKDWFSRLGF